MAVVLDLVAIHVRVVEELGEVWAMLILTITGFVIVVVVMDTLLISQHVPHVEVLVKFDDPGQSDIPYGHMFPPEEDSGDWNPPPQKDGFWFWLLVIVLLIISVVLIFAIAATGAHPG